MLRQGAKALRGKEAPGQDGLGSVLGISEALFAAPLPCKTLFDYTGAPLLGVCVGVYMPKLGDLSEEGAGSAWR